MEHADDNAQHVVRYRVEGADGENGEKLWHFIADPSAIVDVEKGLTTAGWEIVKSEVSFKAKTPTPLSTDQEKDLDHFVELIDDNDDVKRFHLSV